jgi:hypothetical protein
MKILICGGRDFENYERLKEQVNIEVETLKKKFPNDVVEIVSGGARGADALAEKYARETGYYLKIFPAQWEKYGKKAGYFRNTDMARYLIDSDEQCKVIAFWDGESKGTGNMIKIAKSLDLNWVIYSYSPGFE